MTTAAAPLFDHAEARIVHFTGFAHGATHYVELVYPTLAVGLAAEIDLPVEQVLSWSFASYLLFGLGALPAGFAADHLGSRRVIILGLLVAGISCVVAGAVAPGWPLAVALAGIGLGASVYHPAGTGLISRRIQARGRAFGINGIYGNVGIALAPLATAALVSAVGWRMTFFVTGGVLTLAALVMTRVPIDEAPAPDPGVALGSASEQSDAPGPPARSPVLPFVLICIAATLGGFAYRGNTVAQPALFAENISFMGYGLAASLAMLFGIAGQYLGGVIADARDLKTAYLFFHAASLPMLVAVSAFDELPLFLASSVYVFFALGMQPIENSLFATLTPERWRATAYGLKFVLTFGIGSSAVWMVRSVAGQAGWGAVYLVLTGVSAALVTTILVLIATTRKHRMTNG